MAGQRRLWNSVLMPTQSRTIVGGAKTRREPGSTCLCKKSFASGFPGQASIMVTEAVGTFTQASIIVTQAAGRGGQPGQLPHPAALLKRGWGVRERERNRGTQCKITMYPSRQSHQNRFARCLLHGESQPAAEAAFAQQTGQTGSRLCAEGDLVSCRSLSVA